ncbi:MAG: DUF177 domain-containing protein, partial [Gammaproteobacteria bacterium]|nr:DUF177 domain-containing protein [Gammaproteobacteria bacterium]
MLADRIGIPQLRDMAGRSEQVVADVALADLERIADLLSDASGSDSGGEKALHVEAKFADHGQGFPEVECHVTGQLPLVCQRCLDTVEWDLDLKFRLAIVTSEADLERVTEKFDAVVADEHGFDLKDAITDEILSDLPLAPAHAELKDCVAVAEYLADVSDPAQGESEKVNRPFADLGNLLGG